MKKKQQYNKIKGALLGNKRSTYMGYETERCYRITKIAC